MIEKNNDYICWIEPFDKFGPVYCKIHVDTAIKYMLDSLKNRKALPPIPVDVDPFKDKNIRKELLDEFMTIHWAFYVNSEENETINV